ncbi:MAG: hypothetical protein ACREU6_09515 [Steroidobacteraceae bacterium]
MNLQAQERRPIQIAAGNLRHLTIGRGPEVSGDTDITISGETPQLL